MKEFISYSIKDGSRNGEKIELLAPRTSSNAVGSGIYKGCNNKDVVMDVFLILDSDNYWCIVTA